MKYGFLAAVTRFKHFYTQLFQGAAAEYGLSQLEIDILLFLHNNPEYNTARDIVELRGFAKSNVSTAVESLRASGYLTVRRDPENRRVRRLELSPEKGEQISSLVRIQEQGFAVLLTGFAPEEREQIRLFLGRVHRNILTAQEHLEEENHGHIL